MRAIGTIATRNWKSERDSDSPHIYFHEKFSYWHEILFHTFIGERNSERTERHFSFVQEEIGFETLVAVRTNPSPTVARDEKRRG